MRALMVGGGTGGHIYPAIAIAQAIQERILDSQVLFVGSDEGLEVDVVPKERFSLVTIKARGMLRKLTFRSITSPLYAIAGFFDALKIIKSFKPDVIIATGGFVSLPVVFAGFFLRVPTVLHEGNVTPGLSSRICKWFVSCVTIAFEPTRRHFKWKKVYCIGGPVRREVVKAVKGISMQKMGIRQDRQTVLILGGSQGARSINNAVVAALHEMEPLNVQIIHVCGNRDYDSIKAKVGSPYPFYHLIPYMYNIWDGLAAADLVVSRAGATAISEIIARGLPSILIPFPYSAERHQEYNAKLLSDAGASIVLKDNELSNDSLANSIRSVLNDKGALLKMQTASLSLTIQDSSYKFVDVILGLLGINLYAKKRKKRTVKQAS